MGDEVEEVSQLMWMVDDGVEMEVRAKGEGFVTVYYACGAGGACQHRGLVHG